MDVVAEPVYGSRFSKKRKQRDFKYTNQPFKKPRLLVAKPVLRRQSATLSLNQGTHGRELKDIDTDLATLVFDNTGFIILLNGVAQGNDFNTRIGRKFNMKSLYMRIVIQSGSSAVANNMARFLVVYDKQANGVVMTVAQLLTAVSTSAPNNLDNRDRFIVIWDKVVNIGATGANDNMKVFCKKFKRCQLETTNGGTGATIASIQTGALYVVGVGDAATGTVTPRTQNGTFRVRFIDE